MSSLRPSIWADCVDLAAELCEHGVEGLGLGDGAGEAVEEEAGYLPVGGYLVADHALDHLVWYEVAAVDELSGLLAELCAGGHLLTQEISGGEVKIMVFLDDLFGLGAFAGLRWRGEDNGISRRSVWPGCLCRLPEDRKECSIS